MPRPRIVLASLLAIGLAAAACAGPGATDGSGVATAGSGSPGGTDTGPGSATGPSVASGPDEGNGSDGPATVPQILRFDAELVGGGMLEGADLAGAPVALWFWAPW